MFVLGLELGVLVLFCLNKVTFLVGTARTSVAVRLVGVAAVEFVDLVLLDFILIALQVAVNFVDAVVHLHFKGTFS